MLAWIVVLLGAFAPLAGHAAVVTFHENKQLDGNLNGAATGGGSGYALANDWSAITFLDGSSCTSILGAGCGTTQVLLVVDSNLSSTSYGLGGIAFNFAGSVGLDQLTITAGCATCTGPNGTINKASNNRNLPLRAATGAATSDYDVSIKWSNTTAGNQTFVGQTRWIFLLSVPSSATLYTSHFQTTNAGGRYAVASIVKITPSQSGTPAVTASFDAPEPASLAVLGVGLAGLGLVRRRLGSSRRGGTLVE